MSAAGWSAAISPDYVLQYLCLFTQCTESRDPWQDHGKHRTICKITRFMGPFIRSQEILQTVKKDNCSKNLVFLMQFKSFCSSWDIFRFLSFVIEPFHQKSVCFDSSSCSVLAFPNGDPGSDVLDAIVLSFNELKLEGKNPDNCSFLNIFTIAHT